jgi:hypothetical protein
MAFTGVSRGFAAASQDIEPLFERGSQGDANGALDVLVWLGGRASFLSTGVTPSPRNALFPGRFSLSTMINSGPSHVA